MTINNFDDPAIHKTFLISYPLDYTMCLLFGRMTWKIRGYNLNSEKSRDWMVHIKNYWRFKGGEIYQSSRRKMFPDFTMGMMCYEVYRSNSSEKGCKNQVSEKENNIQVS